MNRRAFLRLSAAGAGVVAGFPVVLAADSSEKSARLLRKLSSASLRRKVDLLQELYCRLKKSNVSDRLAAPESHRECDGFKEAAVRKSS